MKKVLQGVVSFGVELLGGEIVRSARRDYQAGNISREEKDNRINYVKNVNEQVKRKRYE